MARKRRRLWLRGDGAIERPGRVRAYLKRRYGSRAFNKDGTIKPEYIDRALNQPHLKRQTRKGSDEHSLKMALILAKRLKKGL